MHIDNVLRVVADGWPQRWANKSNTPHAVAKVLSDIELLPLIMPSLLFPVEFDAEAKFARNKTATHAAAKGPSDTELLPLIMHCTLHLREILPNPAKGLTLKLLRMALHTSMQRDQIQLNA